MAAFAGLAGFFRWKETRLMKSKPPLIPPTLMFYFSLIAFVILAIHMVELVTGQPLPSAWDRLNGR